MKRKVCVVITACPSYSRIKSALTVIQHSPDLELQLVVAASALLDRYGKTVEIIEGDDFEITEAIRSHLSNGRLPSDQLYGDGKAGERIGNLLASVPLTTAKKLAY
jgi:hypothetical protein